MLRKQNSRRGGHNGLSGGAEHGGERADDLPQGFRLRAQLLCRRGAFFGCCGDALRHLLHMGHCAADLLDPAGLLPTACIDLFDQGFDSDAGFGDGLKRRVHLVHLIFSGGGLCGRFFDQ